MSGESFDAGMEAARRTGERLRGPEGDAFRRLDEAQARLQEPGVEVYTSHPTPMPVAVAIDFLLHELRKDHRAMIADLREHASPEAGPLDLHAQAYSSTDYLLSLDLGCTEREDNPSLHDAITTLKMVTDFVRLATRCPECESINGHLGTCSRSAMNDPQHPFQNGR